MNYYKRDNIYIRTANILNNAEKITKEEFEQHMPKFDENQTQELTLEKKIQLNTEELERQAQAIQDLIMLTLEGGE
ncbi:hypothetical protein [Intestinibacter bartlettii]|uniref:hypothetical protein n=1 Tax=Intestinibacter bartlettii TaxID=261299 RepID=UPI0011070E84|nr:hypothetical protein [Intestinibacter bartlettii]